VSRNTITLTAPNGAKVRTVHSKRFFVVSWGFTTSTYNRKTREYEHHADKPVAHVEKRTDSAVAALAALRSCTRGLVFDVTADGQAIALDRRAVEDRASSERQHRAWQNRQHSVSARNSLPRHW
jgi:hypothetical protein